MKCIFLTECAKEQSNVRNASTMLNIRSGKQLVCRSGEL